MSVHDSVREGAAAAGRNPRRRLILWLVALVLLVFIGLQFVRPALTNPPVTADLQAPPEVKRILRKSCYNCHSNETKLPWFDRIVPAYWLVVHDVKEARSHMNFSVMGSLPAVRQKGILFEAVNQIQLGAMPLPYYLWVHPKAAVTPEQLAILRAYVNPPKPPVAASEADVTAADAQYSKWIAGGDGHPQVQDEPNGVGFIRDYKNWTPISSTDRFDNGTLRQILGNDIAIKAIAENRINPWPNGATFAKVTWYQQPDGTGFVGTGAFQQVELMIKDKAKYAATAGWGWGRWRGTDLKPYGADAAFTSECVNCHTPVGANDFVYTMPIETGPIKTGPIRKAVAGGQQ